jgi:spoIIIJ-associated protein
MEKKEIIKKEVEGLVKKIIDNFEIEIQEQGGVYHIDVKTEEAATIIGRFGETIRALQKIFEVILYKKFNQPIQIIFNINDYRERQREKLEKLAKKMAEGTLTTGEPSYLERLSSFERKMIHEYISANYQDLQSYSEGEGKGRRLVITKKTS